MKKLLLLAFVGLIVSVQLTAYGQVVSDRNQSGSLGVLGKGYLQGSSGALPRTVLSRLQDHLSTNDFGADPSGQADSSEAINAALLAGRQDNSPKEVRLPGGSYYVKHPLIVGPNECLLGDGRSTTIIKVDAKFESSARGVLLISGKEVSGEARAPCVRNLQIQFQQPTDVITSARIASPAGSTEIVVASPESIAVGDVVVDASTNGAIPNVTYVSEVNGTNLRLSKTLIGAGVASGDSLHIAGSRAKATTLSQGCKITPGAAPCAYPPAVYVTKGATRWKIDNVTIVGAWDGISSAGGGGAWISDIEISAFNAGIYLDEQLDFDHVHGIHAWVFGQKADNIALYRNMLDGASYSIRLGKADGANFSDINNFYTSIQILSNASNPTFVGVTFDQGARLIVNGGSPTFTGGYFTSALSNLPADHCQLVVNGGRVQITGFAYDSAATAACVSNGTLNVTGGIAANLTPSLPFMKVESKGVLDVIGVNLDALGTEVARSAPIFLASGSGVIRMHAIAFPTTGKGIAVKIETPNYANFLSENSFGVWVVDSKGALEIGDPTHGISRQIASVESLPRCNSDRRGLLYAVYDAVTSTYGSILKGGGSATALALCNGSTWTTH
ncbi:glycosyl hydrolase family 28-related protein [Burkholderia sp. PAMC 26561]|uniref:glycosyl hydrolase family 28-related protein n=1 Tax=Burkholderia sp. PAMC 26561 TaxID=1795043 RepID=UPI00076AECEC|nr:glycosyl hydrolase family 28-related protein [Burkholderia sp. PAMC 26561]AME22897.2 hypothetical protein AXG89_02700 [Burkholderia sp. PAMC 26561]